MKVKLFNLYLFSCIFFAVQYLDAQDLPTAEIISEDVSFCESGDATINIHFTGEGPFAFAYKIDGDTNWLGLAELTNAHNIYENDYEFTLSQSHTATVTLVRVYDNNYQYDEKNKLTSGSGEVSGSMTIQIDEMPTPDAGDDDEICGYEYTMNGMVTDTLHDIWWEDINSDGSFDDDSLPTATFTANDTGTYTFVLHENNGTCESSSFVDVTFKGRPSAKVTTNVVDFCSTDDIEDNIPVEISFDGTGSFTYKLQSTNQIYDALTTSESVVTSNYLVSDSDTITLYSVMDEGTQCQSDSVDMSGVVYAVNLKPEANAGEDSIVCGGDYVLNASLDKGTTGVWSVDEDSISLSILNDANATVSYVGKNIYKNVSLIWTVVESAMECTSSDTVTISFAQHPSVSLSKLTDTICEGSISTLEYALTGNNPLSIMYNDGSTNFTESGITKKSGSIALQPINIDDEELLSNIANYSITKVSDTYGCETSYSDLNYGVTVYNAPSPDAGIDEESCGIEISLNASSPVIGNGMWTGEGTFVDETDPQTVFTGNDFGEYTLKWTETNGLCVSSDEVTVNLQKSAFPVNAGNDSVIYGVDQIQLYASPLQYGSGMWSLLSGDCDFADDTLYNTDVSNLKPGEYEFLWTASVEGANTCQDISDTVNVKIKKLLVPNGFSPNGDGNYDVFTIYGSSNITNSRLTVFDKFGHLVYKMNNYQNDWNGMDNNGRELPDGTYYLVFEGDELSKPIKSFLVIKR